MIYEKVYKNRDNKISLELRSNGVSVDISAATRFVLEIGDASIDSATAGSGVFDGMTYGSDGRLDLKLGYVSAILALTPARYRARLVIFDTTYPNGRVWDELTIEIKGASK